MKRTITSIAAAVAGLSGLALAETDTGVLTAISADASVIAIRDGQSVTVDAGDTVLAGDRLISSGLGSFSVAFGDCSLDVPASSTVVLGEAFCDDAALAGEGLASDTELNLGSIVSGPAGLIFTAAVGAVIVGAVTLADDSEDDAPVSP